MLIVFAVKIKGLVVTRAIFLFGVSLLVWLPSPWPVFRLLLQAIYFPRLNLSQISKVLVKKKKNNTFSLVNSSSVSLTASSSISSTVAPSSGSSDSCSSSGSSLSFLDSSEMAASASEVPASGSLSSGADSPSDSDFD